MLKKEEQGWAIVDAKSGDLMLFDGRMPIYWLRRVAVMVAKEHGFTADGSDRDARICKVSIRQSKTTK